MQSKVKNKDQKNDDIDIYETLNMYWDAVMQDQVFHFANLSKFSTFWFYHNNNKLSPQKFNPDLWKKKDVKSTSNKKKVKNTAS